MPLYEVSINLESHPKLHKFLQHVRARYIHYILSTIKLDQNIIWNLYVLLVLNEKILYLLFFSSIVLFIHVI